MRLGCPNDLTFHDSHQHEADVSGRDHLVGPVWASAGIASCIYMFQVIRGRFTNLH